MVLVREQPECRYYSVQGRFQAVMLLAGSRAHEVSATPQNYRGQLFLCCAAKGTAPQQWSLVFGSWYLVVHILLCQVPSQLCWAPSCSAWPSVQRGKKNNTGCWRHLSAATEPSCGKPDLETASLWLHETWGIFLSCFSRLRSVAHSSLQPNSGLMCLKLLLSCCFYGQCLPEPPSAIYLLLLSPRTEKKCFSNHPLLLCPPFPALGRDSNVEIRRQNNLP